MKILKNNRAFVVIMVYLIAAVLLIMSIGILSRSVHEYNNMRRQQELVQAFYLAEAAVDRAISKFPDESSESDIPVGSGTYSLSVAYIPGNDQWRITGRGDIPNSTSARATRIVEAIITQQRLSDSFFGNAVYSAGNVTLNGNSYSVVGDVTYAGSINDTDNITGDINPDPSAAPLPQLNFEALREIADSQGNVFNEFNLDVENLPDSFYFDEANGIPNVVYIETDLILRGNVGTIGGFFVVVGDVINDPDDTACTTINGNGQIEGCVYTTGEFRVNGGGGGLNINGGVWAGADGARLNGNATVQYNLDYMTAIRDNLNLSTDAQIISWREVRPGE